MPAHSRLGEYTSIVRPFPVTDTAGRPLDLAFLGGFNTPRPQLADLDGDGDLDLVIQEQTHQLILLVNEGVDRSGMPRFTLRSRQWAGLDVGEWSRLVDVNGDHRVDVFGELPFSYLRYWAATGGRGREQTERTAFAVWPDSLRDEAGTPIFSDRQNIPQFVDIDCNGRLDLFVGRLREVDPERVADVQVRRDAVGIDRGQHVHAGSLSVQAALDLAGARPAAGALVFAGEHTEHEHHGTMEGALRSGRRASAQVLQALASG